MTTAVTELKQKYEYADVIMSRHTSLSVCLSLSLSVCLNLLFCFKLLSALSAYIIIIIRINISVLPPTELCACDYTSVQSPTLSAPVWKRSLGVRGLCYWAELDNKMHTLARAAVQKTR